MLFWRRVRARSAGGAAGSARETGGDEGAACSAGETPAGEPGAARVSAVCTSARPADASDAGTARSGVPSVDEAGDGGSLGWAESGPLGEDAGESSNRRVAPTGWLHGDEPCM